MSNPATPETIAVAALVPVRTTILSPGRRSSDIFSQGKQAVRLILSSPIARLERFAFRICSAPTAENRGVGRRDVETIATIIAGGRDNQHAQSIAAIEHLTKDRMGAAPGRRQFTAADVDDMGTPIDRRPDRTRSGRDPREHVRDISAGRYRIPESRARYTAERSRELGLQAGQKLDSQ